MQRTPYSNSRFGERLARLQPRFDAVLAECRQRTRCFLPGELMLIQGEPLSELLLVPQGRIAFHSSVVSGRLFQLGEVECHDQLLGEMELFGGNPIQWSVVARSEIQAEGIDAGRLCAVLEREPELLLFFSCALASDYLDTLEITTSRLLHPIAYNIALELWRDDQRTPMLGSRQSSLEAARFGTIERVYRRAVSELIEKGLIEKRGHQLVVRDRERLRSYLNL